MFDSDELGQIALVVGKVIDEKVPPIVERIIDERVPVIVNRIVEDNLISLMEHQIMPQFDLLHGRIDRMDRKITTQIASKSWTEDRLDRFSADHRLQYKPAF